MEADDFRLQLLDDFAERGVKRRTVGGVDRRCRIEAQLLVVGREPLPPVGFPPGIGVDRLVAEEIQVDRRGDALADDVDLLARLLRRNHGAGQRAQRPALRGGDHEIRIMCAGHRRLHDGKFGLEEVDQSAVRPHGFSLAWVSVQAAADKVAASEQKLLGLGDDAVDDLGRRRNIMDQPDSLAGEDGGDVEIAGGSGRGIFRGRPPPTFCISSTSRPVQRRDMFIDQACAR